ATCASNLLQSDRSNLALSLPKTRYVRIDGEGRQEPDAPDVSGPLDRACVGRVLSELPADPHDHVSGNRWAPCSPCSRKSKTCSRPHRSNALDQAAGLGNFAQAAGVGPKTIRLRRVPQLAVGWPVTRS